MRARLLVSAAALAASAVLPGCGGSQAAPATAPIPAAACEGLSQAKCRAAYIAAGLNPAKCDPATGDGCLDGPVTPPASTEPAPPPAATPALEQDCQMGWVNIPAGSGTAVQDKKFQLTAPVPDTADGYDLGDYEAMRVSLTAEGQDFTVSQVMVVFYDAAGNELSSATASIGEVITEGQTVRFVFDESMGSSPNPPAGAATCNVISYG